MVKVNAHGIQGDAARWIRNWLAGHRQRICINQPYSNLAPVTSGVPQGSVLGPLLFLIYINDRDTNIVSKISKFSDDTKLCHIARNPHEIMELQEDINKLVEWANKWHLFANKWAINLNVDKCSVMHIGHNNMQDNYITCPINNCDNRSTAGSGNHHNQRHLVAKTNREKLKNSQQSTGVHCPQFQVQKQRTDSPII